MGTGDESSTGTGNKERPAFGVNCSVNFGAQMSQSQKCTAA